MEAIKPFIGEIITGLLALVTGWFAKSKAQKIHEKADVLIKVQTLYQRMVKDTNQRMDDMEKEMDDLKKKQFSIDAEWRKKVKQVEQKWQSKYSQLQSKYNKLFKEFEEYKQNHK